MKSKLIPKTISVVSGVNLLFLERFPNIIVDILLYLVELHILNGSVMEYLWHIQGKVT